MTGSQVVPSHSTDLSTSDLIDSLGSFLRINVAGGDASEHTIRGYLSHIRQFADWCMLNAIIPAQATDLDIAIYRRWLVEARYTRGTVSCKLSALRRFFQAAVWKGIRKDNPAEGIKAPRDLTSSADRILEKLLSRKDVLRLLDLPDLSTRTGIRDLAMMGLMYYHGLRVSSVAALSVSDIHTDQNTLSLRNTKGGKNRTIILVSDTVKMLARWTSVRHDFVTKASGDALFLSLSHARLGQRLVTDGIRWIVNRYLARAGVKKDGLSCHALRHAHATHAMDAGADLVALSREMGHSGISTTQVYLHVVDAVKSNPASFLTRERP